MEKIPEKKSRGCNWQESETVNLPVLREMARELREKHQLSSEAISRILHVEIDLVEEILKGCIS
jgi:hypothetical protein